MLECLPDRLRKEDLVVNFEGLIAGTPFIRKIGQILQVLQKRWELR